VDATFKFVRGIFSTKCLLFYVFTFISTVYFNVNRFIDFLIGNKCCEKLEITFPLVLIEIE
jgi:hypothetical protein